MDTSINPVSGAGQHYTPPARQEAASSTTTTAVPAAATDTIRFPVPADTGPSSSQDDAQYAAAVRQAALSFKDVYAVSDQQFSIFKDASGKYITRYVSLRDGKVTYIPEPTLMKLSQISNSNTPRIAISA